MVLVALLRGANLGKKRFSPLALAKELADLDVASIGAAGTFVARGRVTQAALRQRIKDALPFEAEIIVLSEKEVRAAATRGEAVSVPESTRRFATALARAPSRPLPPVPLEAPASGEWGVRVLVVEGRVAIGVRRRMDATGVYPNEVVEKAFGQPATTRDWPTVEKIVKAFDHGSH